MSVYTLQTLPMPAEIHPKVPFGRCWSGGLMKGPEFAGVDKKRTAPCGLNPPSPICALVSKSPCTSPIVDPLCPGPAGASHPEFTMHIQILGSAAGGGFPQWNCNCRNCRGARDGSVRAQPRSQSSI